MDRKNGNFYQDPRERIERRQLFVCVNGEKCEPTACNCIVQLMICAPFIGKNEMPFEDYTFETSTLL